MESTISILSPLIGQIRTTIKKHVRLYPKMLKPLLPEIVEDINGIVYTI